MLHGQHASPKAKFLEHRVVQQGMVTARVSRPYEAFYYLCFFCRAAVHVYPWALSCCEKRGDESWTCRGRIKMKKQGFFE